MVPIVLWRPLEEIQERSLQNHSWPPALGPPGSTARAAGATVASPEHSPRNCSWGREPPVDITEVLRGFGGHTEPCDPSPR